MCKLRKLELEYFGTKVYVRTDGLVSMSLHVHSEKCDDILRSDFMHLTENPF